MPVEVPSAPASTLGQNHKVGWLMAVIAFKVASICFLESWYSLSHRMLHDHQIAL